MVVANLRDYPRFPKKKKQTASITLQMFAKYVEQSQSSPFNLLLVGFSAPSLKWLYQWLILFNCELGQDQFEFF